MSPLSASLAFRSCLPLRMQLLKDQNKVKSAFRHGESFGPFSLVWHNLLASGPTTRLLVLAATYDHALMHGRCRVFTDFKAGS